jgi:UDP-hydrolysing UDP-N-acetyl-D-glucosamine 2-epimerase
MKKICVITGSRAEYGLLKNVIINLSKFFDVKIVATGTHLSKNHGYTINNIIGDNIIVDYELNMLLSNDNDVSVSKSMGIEIIGLSDYFGNHKFDYIMVLGDRYEILACVLVATIFQIKIIHFCGGDTTEGSYDDDIRNAITQLSHIHFVSCEESKNKVESFGKKDVFVVGNPGLEFLINFEPKEKKHDNYVLFVYHVETKNINNLEGDIFEIGKLFNYVLNCNINIICIGTNSDNNNNKIKDFYKSYDKIIYYDNLRRDDYLSLAYHSDLFIGNSSSGIYEIPYFNKYVINIGNRQSGRRNINNVINTKCEFIELKDKFDNYYKKTIFSEGGFPVLKTTEKIINILNNIK